MQKIGKYTGKDYTNEQYNTFLCPECYVVVDADMGLSTPSKTCETCIQGCPARTNGLSLSSPKAVWDKAILETFRFVGYTSVTQL